MVPTTVEAYTVSTAPARQQSCVDMADFYDDDYMEDDDDEDDIVYEDDGSDSGNGELWCRDQKEEMC